MRSGTRFLTVAALVTAIAALTFGAANEERVVDESCRFAAVANVVKSFQTALSSGDAARALSLLAADAVILESGGVESRSEYPIESPFSRHRVRESCEVYARAVARQD